MTRTQLPNSADCPQCGRYKRLKITHWPDATEHNCKDCTYRAIMPPEEEPQ